MLRTDPFLPIAPAQIKALVLPVGPVRQDRFAAFLERLHGENAVHLRDISADSRPNRNMFNPLAFPDGVIFYDFITHVPPPSHIALTPFENFREPLVVLALADGAAIKDVAFGSRRQSTAGRSLEERNIRTLYQELEALRDTYTRVLVHRVIIFDYVPAPDAPIPIPDDMATIPPAAQSKRTTMRTAMCDVSSLLLAEMNTLARSFEGMSYIETPGQAVGEFATGGGGIGGSGNPLPSRRNSQFALPSGSGTNSSADRAQARMSMPAPFKDGSSTSLPGRSASSARSGLSGPAMTLDDLGGTGSASGVSSPERSGSPLSDGGIGFRSSSAQDHRVSVQGFGPGGLNDRWRNKGKCRITILMASLYLQAGRWTDALKELVDGATVARSMNDHVWHGKALELIVICLLLLAWADLEFQVPSVCLVPPEKGAAAAAAAAAYEAAEKANPRQPRWLRQLQLLLPELLDRILALYSRLSGERLPPLPQAETAVRFCNILTALHAADGVLGKAFLAMVIEGQPTDGTAGAGVLTTSPRLGVMPARPQILAAALRAFPAAAAGELVLTTVDRIVILSGIASVLGRLGYRRKRALVVRELLAVLTDGLVEARTRGAAEMGIHPAAGLLAPGGVALDLAEGDSELGVDAFLGLLLRTYGVVEADEVDTNAAVLARVRSNAAMRQFGVPALKVNILRGCINFAEALPDFAGVAKFSSDLLRTAGSGVAPGPRREDAGAIITRDEQVRLETNIAKATGLGRRLGVGNVEAEYWDEFLVRGIRLETPPGPCVAVAHAGSELALRGGVRGSQGDTAATAKDVDPFIHNPFLKAADKTTEPTLVAMEPATFRVTMQNPFDMEVMIESIRLETEGVDFESAVESAVIGPYRTQIVRVGGTPLAPGRLRVTGAVVRVQGCRERRFPILVQPWVPERPDKVKTIGVVVGGSSIDGTLTASRLTLQVIPAQPLVVVQSTTLAQSSAMILEGETQVFSMTLQNLSTTTAADFFVFSFADSTQPTVQAALTRRDASPAELYEYELVLAKKQALRLRKRTDGAGETDSRRIEPGATATYEFEILGKPGLTDATIQVDYAHVGAAEVADEGQFYTRQVSLHLTVTVNASVEVVRMDVLPLHGGIPLPLWERCGKAGGVGAGKTEGADTDDDAYCLLLMDLRNAWPSDMQVRLSTGPVDDADAEDAVVTEHILPGNTSRVLVPLRRIYLENPHASIPVLNPARQRQFVVSTGRISPEMERASREAFWYRERILAVLRGTWTAGGGPMGGRHGAIELRGMHLTGRMIEAVRVDEVGIEIGVGEEADDTARTQTQTQAAADTVQVDTFMHLRVRITNRTARPIHPLLRVMPALSHRPLNVALDFTRKFWWNGTLQQGLAVLGPHETTEVRIGATALCRGAFEVTASVEETRVWSDTGGRGAATATGRGGRPRSETETLMDSVLGATERRIWHSRAPYRFDVVD